LLADATYAWPVDIICQYYVTGLQPSAVEHSLLQARQSATLYRTVSETRLSAAAISDNYLRRTSSTVTQYTQRSRDAALHDSVLYKCTIDMTLTLTQTEMFITESAWVSK